MNKIIATFDGLKYSESTTRYAIDLAKKNGAHLVGVFLEDFLYSGYKVYDLAQDIPIDIMQKKLAGKDRELRRESVVRFETACRQEGVNYSVHRDKNIAIRELLHESAYADLLIINARETFTHHNEKKPTSFIRELLVHAECPLLITPHLFQPIDKVAFFYDGSPSSVYAIRMLSYSLPASKDIPVEVVCIKDEDESKHMPENFLIHELVKRHYASVTFNVLRGVAREKIHNYLREQSRSTLVVMGAYHRRTISRWINESMADIVLRELNLPLFVAHGK